MIIYNQVWNPLKNQVNPDMIRVEEDNRVYFISNDPKNQDWLRYQAWIAEDNKPLSDAPLAQPKEIPSLESIFEELKILKIKVETLERDRKSSESTSP